MRLSAIARIANGRFSARNPPIAAARVSATVGCGLVAIGAATLSGPKIFEVFLLDLVDLRLDGLWIVLHQLDFSEQRPSWPLLDQPVRGAQRSNIDDQLLALRAERIDREKPRRVGV